MKITISISHLVCILGVSALFLGYDFMLADAPANPPSNNAAAPINIGVVNQVKNGGLSLNSLLVAGNMQVTGAKSTFTQVRATQYCDENGENCRDSGEDSAGTAFGGVFTTDDLKCVTPNPVTGNCSCPNGYTRFFLEMAKYDSYTGEHSGGNYTGSTYSYFNVCVGK